MIIKSEVNELFTVIVTELTGKTHERNYYTSEFSSFEEMMEKAIGDFMNDAEIDNKFFLDVKVERRPKDGDL